VIKLTFCLVRAAHLTPPAFRDYWQNIHGPLVASLAGELGIRRYAQLYALPPDVQAGLRPSRGPTPDFDGVATVWFDSLEAFAANYRRPEARAAVARVLEDEARFIDLDRSPLWWSHERVFVG
jgi:uncharacterized protein (TIGR02118 family)